MNIQIMLNPQRYGYRECTHCNGYGSSFKEDCATCSQCGGSGLVKDPAAHPSDSSQPQPPSPRHVTRPSDPD